MIEFKRAARQSGLERRLLATVRWTVATAVAFPQESESLPTTSLKRLTETPTLVEVSLSLLEIQTAP